ncbi:obscurin-like protein 1a isoform X17 [Chiloscyllium plagiosum]|uniref:obscurin-like protein 1a isoform X17 n=1 Tax=Chiloscyllium plagiosum TaxID=36176 RepID=UPI001CB7E139|nr:obscurin-like protein 1a isoform X17 [Chiloscyllium plagiosum]
MDVFGGAPRFLSYPRTFTVPNGADAVLKCQIAGDPRPTVIWERDKTQISPHGRYRFLEDGNVYNLVVSRARVEDSGQYICKAKNSVGETYAAATLKVEECDGDPENRPAFVVKPTSARVVRGHDVVFTGRLAGSPMPAVTWEKDGKKLTEIFESGHFSEGCDGEGWHHLKIFSARMPDAGVYLCKARNPLGEAMSAAVLLVEPGDAPHEPAPPTTASNGLGVSEGSGAQRIRREARRGKRHRLPHREPHSASGVARQSHATEDPPRACKVKVFSVTEGKHAKFRCYVTGKPKPEIFWRKDGRLVAPGRRHLLYEDREGYFILKVLYCKQQDNGLYACAASNAAGQTLSSVLLNVKEPRIKFKNQLQDVEVNEREQAILECEVPGDSIPAVWYLEDRKLHSSAKYIIEQQGAVHRLTIKDVTMDDDGVYLCEMKDGGRSIAEVAVKGKIVKRLPRKLDVVEGENAAFCVDLDEENVEVSWYKDGELLTESHKTIIKSFGKTHILVFVNVTVEDSGVITFVISDSKSSSQLRVKPRRHIPPSAPVNVRMSCEKPNVASLLWASPPDCQRNGVTGYVIERQELGTEEWVRCLTTEGSTVVEILGESVSNEARYRFRVCSVNNYGKSEQVEFPGVVHLVPSARIRTHLSDMTLYQDTDAEFTIELSTSVLGTWHMKGQQLHNDERFKIDQSRTRHMLLIRGVKVEENESEITFVAHGVRDSAILFVKAIPVKITLGPGMETVQQITASESIILCCEVSRPNTKVQWCKDGEILTPSDRVSVHSSGHVRKLIVQSARPSDSGQYVCDATEDSLMFTVNVLASPVRIVNTTDDTKMEYLTSECIVLTCELSRSNAEVKWYRNGLEIEGSGKVKMESHGVHRSLIIEKAGTEDSGEYVCDAGDDSIFYDITVREPPVRIVNSSSSLLSVLTGGEIVLSCEVSQPKAEVRWYKDGVEVEQSERSMMEVDRGYRKLTICPAALGDQGTYVCKAVDISAKFEVTVSDPPVRIVDSTSPALNVLTGSELVLLCKVSQPEAEVRWYKDGVEVEHSERAIMEVDGRCRRLTIHPATMGDQGTYLCDAVDVSAKFEVTVSEPPVRIITSSSPVLSVLTGSKIFLSCELSQPQGEVRWHKDGVEVEQSERSTMEVNGTCRRLTICPAVMDDQGIYMCDAVDDLAKFEVTVSEPPVRIINSSSPVLSVLTGAEVVLTCELSRPKAEVSWYKDGVEVKQNENCRMEVDGRRRRLTIRQVTVGDGGIYLCDAINDAAKFEVTVSVPPVRIINSSSPVLSVLTGAEVVLSCELSRPKAEVRWYKDGIELKRNKNCRMEVDGIRRRLTIRQVTVGDGGLYLCDAVDDSAKFEVTVSEPPVRIVNSSPPMLSVLTGGKVVLSCELSRPKAEVRWYKDGVEVEQSERSTMEVDGGHRRLTIHPVTMGDRGTYLCDAVDDLAKFEVTVSELPLKIIRRSKGPAEHKYLISEDFTLQCELSRSDGVAKWYKDGEKVVENKRISIRKEGMFQLLRVLDADTTDTGEYLCDVQSDSIVFRVCVEEPPIKIIRQTEGPTEHKYLTSEVITLQCELSQLDGVAKWYKDGEKMVENERIFIGNEGAFRSLRVLDARTTDSGEYLCDVQSDSVVFGVCVQEPPVKIIRQTEGPAEHKYLTSENIMLQCELSRLDGVAKWYKDGEKVVENERISIGREGTFRSLRVLDAQTTDSGEYLCDVQSDRIVFRVHVEEPLVKIIRQFACPAKQKYLTSEDFVLQCELSRPDVVAKWYKNGEKVVENERISLRMEGTFRSLQVLEAQVTDSGEYLCDVQSDSIVFRVHVEEPPVKIIRQTKDPAEYKYLTSEDITLQCELSWPDGIAKWYKDRVNVVENERITMGREGTFRSLQILDARTTDSGEYLCDVQSDNIVFRVRVEDPPVMIVGSSHISEDRSFIESETIAITCKLCHPDVQVRWSKDGIELRPSDKIRIESRGLIRELMIFDSEPSDSGQYVCDADSDKLTFKVTVTEAPVLFTNKEKHPEEVYANENGQAVLAAIVSKEPASVTWYRHKEQVTKGEKYEMKNESRVHSLIIKNVLKNDSGFYICRSTDDEMIFNVNMTELPLIFVLKLEDVCVQRDGSITLWCELNKVKGDVMWLKDGKEVRPSRKHVIRAEGRLRSLTLCKATLDDEGEYSCESKDDRTVGRVSVRVPRVVEFISDLRSITVLEGDDAKFKCMVSPEDVRLSWHVHGREVPPGSTKYVTSRNGLCHMLLIQDCQLTDIGQVIAEAEGIVSTANLQVQETQVVFTRKLVSVVTEERQDATFEVEVSNESAEVQWMKQGVVIQSSPKFILQQDGRTRRLIICDTVFSDRGNYRCETLHDRTQAKLIIEPRRISVRKPLEDMEIFEKEAVTFQVELSHVDVDGMWIKDGIRVKPNNNRRISCTGKVHSLTLSALTLEDSGTVTFQADNVRSTSRITVREPPVTFLKELKDLRVPESTAITLECELSRPNVEVIWYKDDLEMKPNKNVRIYSMGRKRIAQLGKCGVQDSGTYSCDAGECKTSGKLEVFEQEIQIVKELEDQEVRENNNAVFVCEVSHAEVKSEWLQNGNRIKSNSNVKIRQEGTKHFMLIYKVRAEDAGEIRFRAKNAESVARLDVNGILVASFQFTFPFALKELPVKIVKPLRDKTALEKHKVILECKVSKPHAHVCWYRGGEELYASSKYEICSEDCYRQLVIHDVSFEDEATYTCDAFDDCSSAKVLVEEQAILIMKDLVDMEVTAPNAIQLECEVSVPMIRAPQWSLNGQLLQNGDGVRIENRGTIQRLILSNTSPDMSGVVKFTAGKARCSAKLTVKGE